MTKDQNMPGARAFVEEIADLIAERLKHCLAKKELYNLEEASLYRACSQEQVRHFIKTRQLPTVKIDRRPRFRVRDLERFVAASIE